MFKNINFNVLNDEYFKLAYTQAEEKFLTIAFNFENDYKEIQYRKNYVSYKVSFLPLNRQLRIGYSYKEKIDFDISEKFRTKRDEIIELVKRELMKEPNFRLLIATGSFKILKNY